MRSGIIAKKIGMSNLYTQSGTNIPVTVLHVENCKIIDRITSENENSDKVLVGACKLKKHQNHRRASLIKNQMLINILESLKLVKTKRLKVEMN